MSRRKLFSFLVIAATVALLGFLASLASGFLGADFRLTYLAFMLIAYLAISAYVAVRRSRLAEQFRTLPAAQRADLAELYPELRYAAGATSGGLSARAATWVGILLIGGPLIPIMIGPLFVWQQAFGSDTSLPAGAGVVLLGFLLAWSWWSIGVTLWRRWATRRGVDPGELQWRGENANLLWPAGHLFERTELEQILNRVLRRLA